MTADTSMYPIHRDTRGAPSLTTYLQLITPPMLVLRRPKRKLIPDHQMRWEELGKD